MGKLAKLLKEASFSSPQRVVELLSVDRLIPGSGKKVFAKIHYVDPVEFRADDDALKDKEFRSSFASAANVQFSEDKSFKSNTLSVASLMLLCPRKLLGMVGQEGQLGTMNDVVDLDQEDCEEIVREMDGVLFATLYYEACSLAEFVKSEVERLKNASQSTSASPTPQIPQESVTALSAESPVNQIPQ
ncbi:MAG: hypothetical protein KatS3mg054_0115 [Chloroflexus sp.]|nr:MAG: hypothetical protein KatS3mg054_0115 [Chloroflexus sp.]